MARPSFETVCPDCGTHNVVARADSEEKEIFVLCRCGREGSEKVRRVRKRGAVSKKKRSKLGRRLSERWWRYVGPVCANCGTHRDRTQGIRVEGHHVVRQALIEARAREEGWSQEKLDHVLWDERNRLDVCERCHGGHHRKEPKLSWALIEKAAPKAPQFAREIGLLGRAGREYEGGPR